MLAQMTANLKQGGPPNSSADAGFQFWRAFARHWQRQVEQLDAADADDGSEGRRDDLERTTARSLAQLAAAEARRRRPTDA